MKPTSFRFIDLFAGLGGFHLALQRMGGRCVFAAEWKQSLRDLYKVNHGIYPKGDITMIEPSMVPDHDILTAGFPCQPFSKAGEQLGFECTKQGGLFFNVEAILDEKKPSFFILENVPNLLKHDGGRTWEEIQQRLGLDGLGYHVRSARFSPHNFGIPQIRERVYIVGSRLPLTSFKWPEVTNDETCIDSVLDDYPEEAKRLSPQVSALGLANDIAQRVPPVQQQKLWALVLAELGQDAEAADEQTFDLGAALDNLRLIPAARVPAPQINGEDKAFISNVRFRVNIALLCDTAGDTADAFLCR